MRALTLAIALLALTACTGKSADSYIASAKDAIAQADYSRADTELKNALEADNESAEARWLLGTVLLDTGDILSAEEQLLRAAELGWQAQDIRPALARALLAQGKFDEALALEHAELPAEPAARLLSTQAMAALADQQTDKAREMAALALQKAPDLHAAKLAQATLLVREDDMDGAMALLQEIEQEAPADDGALWLKGQILLLQGDLEGARDAMDSSIANSSDAALADHIMRALVSIRLKDYEAALLDAEFVLDHNPQNPTANYIVGVNRFHAGDHRNAIARLGIARPVAPQFPLVLYYLSSAYLIDRELDLAESFASELYELVPDDANARTLLAAIMLLKGRSDDALDLLEPVLDHNPGDVQALNFKANALLVNGRVDEGMLLYAQVARLQPQWRIVPLPVGSDTQRSDKSADKAGLQESLASANSPQTQILDILNHLARKDFEGAIEKAESYHLRDPANIASLNVLGRVYFATGNAERAKESFEAVLKREPGNGSANWSMAEIALAAGDMDAARKHYEAVLQADPRNLTTLIKAAELEARAGDARAMVAHLSEAISGNPTALAPRLLVAQYYLQTGDTEKVEPLFTELSALQRRSPRALELTALAQLSLKQHDRAFETLTRWTEESPTSAQAHYLLAVAANATGNAARSREALQDALEQDPKHVQSLISLARFARFDNDKAAFDKYVATLVEIAPDAPEVLRLRALSAQADGRKDEALQLAQQGFEQAPSTQRALELASLQMAAGKNDAATDTLSRWVKEKPDDIDARLFLANHLSQQEDEAQAREQYLAVLERDADNLTALNNLAWMLRLDKPEQALQYIRRAAEIAPNVPELLDTLAVVEYHNGNHEDARGSIRRAMQATPDNPTMRYHDAMISAALGDTDEAVATLQALLQAGAAPFPQRQEAQALLDKLSG